MLKKRPLSPTLVLISLLLAPCACNNRREIPPETPPEPADIRDTLLADTIGNRTLIGSGAPMMLRGFGLVYGLGENGARDCPTTLREYLVDFLTKELVSNRPGSGRPGFSPGRLIDSLDTAVVAVYAVVPPGAPRGTRMDVQIEAVGAQTRSLAGGVLLPCELKIFQPDAAGRGLIAGRPLARASGPVFTNPFAGEGSNATVSTRRAYVLGGGHTLQDRTARLLLSEPSYALARRIEQRVNERFGHSPPAAEAMSRGYLTLSTPAPYGDEPEHFIQLTSHLFFDDTPQFVERKLNQLLRELDGPDGTLDHISLAWEGIGRTAISHIQPLYSHDRPAVRFYASRAGLRLRDVSALSVMAEIATTPANPYRLLAIRALGSCDMPRAATYLATLLDSDDQELRIAAYEALLNYHHPAIETHMFAHNVDPTFLNMKLDLVQSTGDPLIYVRRTREPRIAIFGDDLPLAMPLFYSHPQERAVLNASDGDTEVALFCRTPSGRRMDEPLIIPAQVKDLVESLAQLPIADEDGRFPGIGLHYSLAIEVLDSLCSSGTITAPLVMEHGALTDLLGPTELPERPESDRDRALFDSEEGDSQTKDAEPLLPGASEWERPE